MGDIFRQGLQEAWADVITFVPRLLAFLVIMLVGWLLAKLLARAADVLLTRTGVPRLLERAGLGAPLTRARVDLAGLIVRIVYLLVLLVAAQLAFGVFGPNPVSALLDRIIGYLPNVVVAILLVVVAMAVGRSLRGIVQALLAGRPAGPVLGIIVQGFLVGLGVIAALGQLGIALAVAMPVLITVLATIGGILVVGVGGGLVRPMQSRWERWLSVVDNPRGTTRD